jgi:hypothetical protein
MRGRGGPRMCKEGSNRRDQSLCGRTMSLVVKYVFLSQAGKMVYQLQYSYITYIIYISNKIAVNRL